MTGLSKAKIEGCVRVLRKEIVIVGYTLSFILWSRQRIGRGTDLGQDEFSVLVRYWARYLGLPSWEDHLEKFKYLEPNHVGPDALDVANVKQIAFAAQGYRHA